MRARTIVTLLAFVLPCACGPTGQPGTTDAQAGATHGATAATPVSLRYRIEGMHCDGCVQAITDKVTHVDGVLACQVSLQQRRADVSVREASLAPAVRKAIERLGYTVTPEPDAPSTASP